MNIRQRLALKIWNFGEPKHSHLLEDVGWHTVSGSSIDYYYQNNYENAYPSIRVIAQKFASVEPYTIDKSGKSVESNVLDRLYTPNNQMSAYDFREALAVMSLVHNKVYIRVHNRNGGGLTEKNITGFTFLEGVREHIVDGELQYWLPNGEKLGTDKVAVLKDINPYNLNDGFSHAFAARRWTSLDDLIADYQAGFFNNGAVPSGQFIITAKTANDFKDIVANLQERHRGAGKNNNVMYVHRPTDATGKPTEAQVEWVPFATENKNMALGDLFEQANKKIDSVYGVPASLRGVNDSNTYASVRVDQQIFIENTLEPFTLKVWQKFTHELNRITKGLGVAITFDIETPVVADEEKVKAEAKQADALTVTTLTNAGYTVDSAVQFVQSGDISVLVKPPEEVEQAEVLDSDEAKDTPDQPVDPSQPASKAFEPTDRDRYASRLESVVRSALERQTDAALELVKSKAVTPESPVDEAEDERLYDEIAAVLVAAMAFQGPIEHSRNAAVLREAGVNVQNISPFLLTASQRSQYDALLRKVARDINATTANKIRTVLAQGRELGLTAAEIRTNLKGLVEAWRIRQIAVTEVNYAGNSASVYSMQNIAKETGARVLKKYEHAGGDSPCPLCQSFIAMAPVDVTETFLPEGSSLTLVDGTRFTNQFADVDGTRDPHPNGHCRQVYEVVR